MSSQGQDRQVGTTLERHLEQIHPPSVAIYPPPPVYIRDPIRFVEPETLPAYANGISPPAYSKREVLRSPLTSPNDTVGVDELLSPVAPYEWLVPVRRTPFQIEAADTVAGTRSGAKSRFLGVIFILFALATIGAIIFGFSRIPH